MQAQYFKLTNQLHQTISIRKDIRSAFFDHWHYHSELELVYILKGEGVRFIGDDISRFCSGDLVLLGVGLPHVWKSDENYFKLGSKEKVSAIVLHFGADFLGKGIWELPEMCSIKKLIEMAPQGISYKLNEEHSIKQNLKNMVDQNPFERLITLLVILNDMSKCKAISILSSISFAEHYQKHHSSRIDEIYDYILTHFEKDIKLDELAKISNMTSTSLCRFFKQKTRKTISELVNEVRVGYACKLLIGGSLSISEICFKCGYNNLSYFNRQFKKIVGITPGDYQKRKSIFEEGNKNIKR